MFCSSCLFSARECSPSFLSRFLLSCLLFSSHWDPRWNSGTVPWNAWIMDRGVGLGHLVPVPSSLWDQKPLENYLLSLSLRGPLCRLLAPDSFTRGYDRSQIYDFPLSSRWFDRRFGWLMERKRTQIEGGIRNSFSLHQHFGEVEKGGRSRVPGNPGKKETWEEWILNSLIFFDARSNSFFVSSPPFPAGNKQKYWLQTRTGRESLRTRGEKLRWSNNAAYLFFAPQKKWML